MKYQTDFTIIPNALIRNHTLTHIQKIVLFVLYSYSPNMPAYDILAADVGINRSEVLNIIQELYSLGYIHSKIIL